MKKVEIHKPSTWVKYKPSLCKGCFAGCCTLPVLVTAEELYHLGFLKYEEVSGPLKPHVEKLKKKKIIKSFNTRTQLFTLYQHPNNDCVFLTKERLCAVYDRRPNICREFPKNSKRPGYCPNQKFVKDSAQ
ncbi:MAG: YkgJ family cysteine cluster protein [Pseudomonadota bacterium]